jgi:ketosteroid isomerase-like protein
MRHYPIAGDLFMNFRKAIFACVAMVASAASAAGADSSSLAQQILDAEAAELAAWEKRDIEAIMNAYAPDAIVMPGGAVIPDRDALRALFVGFLGDPGFTLTFRSDPPLVARSGDLGVTVGTYAVSFTDPQTQEVIRRTGRHLMTWQLQEDGEWRVTRQMTGHDR